MGQAEVADVRGARATGDAAFWLAFSRVRHIGPVRIERLLQRFGTLEMAWNAKEDELRVVLEARALEELLKARRALDPQREIDRISMRGIVVTHPGHPMYPPLLAEISGRPTILYVQGTLIETDLTAIGVVGTRRSTAYGRQAAEAISHDLAAAGVTVISGLARGVDAAAHNAALEAGGRTVAVLGSGCDVIYPAEHRNLAERICAAGAIVSEQPPGAKPDAQNFPARNRIISGMSLGIVVIEAPMRSGALITASFAADQGREVFVVPGNVNSQNSDGANQLLRDGARIVRNGLDILQDLNLVQEAGAKARQPMLLLDSQEERMLACIGSEPKHIDELAEESNMRIAAASSILIGLELKGIVSNLGAQHYIRR